MVELMVELFQTYSDAFLLCGASPDIVCILSQDYSVSKFHQVLTVAEYSHRIFGVFQTRQ